MGAEETTVFDRLSSLADATRSRILLLLERHELTVSELCRVLQLPQSTVSRHLKGLADVAWIAARAEADRKSTRLNSSHVSISYAVFCLKKKKYKYLSLLLEKKKKKKKKT